MGHARAVSVDLVVAPEILLILPGLDIAVANRRRPPAAHPLAALRKARRCQRRDRKPHGKRGEKFVDPNHDQPPYLSFTNHLRRGVAWDLISRKSEGRLITELMGHCCTPLVTTFSILRFLKKGIRFLLIARIRQSLPRGGRARNRVTSRSRRSTKRGCLARCLAHTTDASSKSH